MEPRAVDPRGAARTEHGREAAAADRRDQEGVAVEGAARRVLEHRAIARTYTIGGAAGISVLTESKYFQGSIDFLSDCRVSIDGYYPGGRPAMLRKDFIFDPYQVHESRAYGADAILLIVSILTDAELRELVELAHGCRWSASSRWRARKKSSARWQCRAT